VILDIQPIPYLAAVAVDRKRISPKSARDRQGDQLLRELVVAVVVGAVGGEGEQPVGVMIGPNRVAACRDWDDTGSLR
jgi:hypothetical protein